MTIDTDAVHEILLDAINDALVAATNLKDDARSGAGYGIGILHITIMRKLKERAATEQKPAESKS